MRHSTKEQKREVVKIKYKKFNQILMKILENKFEVKITANIVAIKDV